MLGSISGWPKSQCLLEKLFFSGGDFLFYFFPYLKAYFCCCLAGGLPNSMNFFPEAFGTLSKKKSIAV